MFKSKKIRWIIIVTIGIIFTLIGVIRVGLFRLGEQKTETIKSETHFMSSLKNNSKPQVVPGTQKRLSPREEVIKQIMESHVDYKKFYLDDKHKEVIIVGYGSNDIREILDGIAINHPEHDKKESLLRYGGGILAFESTKETVKLLWESNERIVGDEPKIEVIDINNDGYNEVISLWRHGEGTSKNPHTWSLWIHSWRGNTFELISPLIIAIPHRNNKIVPYKEALSSKRYDSLFFGDYVAYKDLDNDKIAEVIVHERRLIRTLPEEKPFPEAYLEASDLFEVLYKWNGKEFYPWQDRKINAP